MKLLIAHGGKSGGCRSMAALLAELLPRHQVTLTDLIGEMPDPADFDHVVLGGAVRMGRLDRRVREYMKRYRGALTAVPHTLFLCCAFAEHFENYAEMLFPGAILESAEECVYFGGELNPTKQKGLDRLLVRMMRNAVLESEDNDAMLPGLLPEHVRQLADRLKGK